MNITLDAKKLENWKPLMGFLHSAIVAGWRKACPHWGEWGPITSLVNIEAIERNRYYFSTFLIDLIPFLATLQLAFKRKIDVFESEDEGENGLFLSLLNCIVGKDQRLRTIIKTIPRNRICKTIPRKSQRTPVPICKTIPRKSQRTQVPICKTKLWLL